MTKATKNATVIMIMTAVFTFLPIFALAVWANDSNSFRVTYYAKAGDSLQSISSYYGLDCELVAAMNNMDPEARINRGQRIYLPREPETIYVLGPGDTLWSIAQKYRINIDDLINHNQILNPDKLQIGQVIKIPIENSEEMLPVKVVAQPKIEVASRGMGILSLPVIGGVISSGYGWRQSGFHHGTDIAAPVGTPIRAIKAGVVTFSGWRPIYGYTVIIDHGDEIQSVYGHASKLLVKKEQKVSRGQIIAKVGDTGRTTGPHLHLEIHIGGKTVNPMRYLQKI